MPSKIQVSEQILDQADIKKRRKISQKRIVAVILGAAVLLLATASIWYALALYSTHELLTRTADMSFDELLGEALAGRKDACVTVGILKGGQMSYEVYGEDGERLENAEYRSEYYEWSMLPYVFRHEENPFRGIGGETILEEYRNAELEAGKAYRFSYSNYGFALLGLVLEEVYGADYTSLLNAYLADEFAMEDTCVSNSDSDFAGDWQWAEGDAYIPAGAVVSDISDMLLYAQAQLGGDSALSLCHRPLTQVNASDKWARMAGLCVDEVGMSWMIDTEHKIIWHNGGTGMHSSYLGFCPEKNTAVVVLSNLSQDEDIPATTIGFKKLLEVSPIAG